MSSTVKPLRAEAAMDVPRDRSSRNRGVQTALFSLLAIAAIAAATFVVFTRSASGPIVERASIITDVAQRGTLVRSVAASGTLAADSIRIVDAVQPGVVESVYVKPGSSMRAGEVVARLSNPDLEADVVGAQSALDVAQADLRSAEQEMQASALSQQSSLASAEAQMQEDSMSAQSLANLHRSGYVADSTYRIATIKRAQSRRQVQLSRAQIGVDAANQAAKVAAARAHVNETSAVLRAKEQELNSLVIRAGAPGIVQSVNVDPGARVDAGAEVARIADVRTLKAVLQVPENQVRDIIIGMPCSVDTGNGIVQGRVSRIAPSANNGAVPVDVTFASPLPSSARPDLNVNATIALDRIPNAVSIARPAGANDNSTVNIYRVAPGGGGATLVQVRLGAGTADRVQVLSGLTPGDTVIISDMSAYAGKPALTIR